MRNTNPGASGFAAVDEYLAGLPEPARSTLSKVRAMIRSSAPPEASEALYYRMPAFRYKKPLLGYAAFKHHCSLFVMSGTVLDGFTEELRTFQISKGTIRFPMDQPLPPDLVQRLVTARLAEIEAGK